MKRLLIILAALALGACTSEVVDEEVTGKIGHADGTRYVGYDDLGGGDPGAQKIMHMGIGGPNMNPASTRQGPFPDPWEDRTGPFPDPWTGDEAAPAPGDKP